MPGAGAEHLQTEWAPGLRLWDAPSSPKRALQPVPLWSVDALLQADPPLRWIVDAFLSLALAGKLPARVGVFPHLTALSAHPRCAHVSLCLIVPQTPPLRGAVCLPPTLLGKHPARAG